MKIRQLAAGVTLALAATSAFAHYTPAPTPTPTPALPAFSSTTYDLGDVHSPYTFILNNTVKSQSFTDYIKFSVNPSSYAEQVYFNQLTLGSIQNIASATLSLTDLTTGISYGSVVMGEPVFTAAEIFYTGHLYQLTVDGTLGAGAKQGVYGLTGLLTPVPEPETWALLGLGMVSLVAARARARKRASGRLETNAA